MHLEGLFLRKRIALQGGKLPPTSEGRRGVHHFIHRTPKATIEG